MEVHVKICGITRAEDAMLAAALGASAVGFVFWPGSPRAVDPVRALQIAGALPPSVMTVGVFVDQEPDFVEETANRVGLGAVQLHGAETAAFARRLSRPVIKATTGDPADDGALAAWPLGTTLLVDAADARLHGGTGIRADWAAAARLARRHRVFLAGGLSAANVADAISVVRPYGVDVSSGIETRPGVKDARKMQALFAAVRAARGVVA